MQIQLIHFYETQFVLAIFRAGMRNIMVFQGNLEG